MKRRDIHPSQFPGGLDLLGKNKGFVIGARGWELLRLDTDAHFVTMAKTGGGKGRSVAIPNILVHPGSVLSVEIGGATLKTTIDYRRHKLKQKVHVFDPFGVTGEPCANLNLLDTLDPARETFDVEVSQIAESLMQNSDGKKEENVFFQNVPEELIASMITYVVTDKNIPPDQKNFVTVAKLLDQYGTEEWKRLMVQFKGDRGEHAHTLNSTGNYFTDVSRSEHYDSIVKSAAQWLRFATTKGLSGTQTQSDFRLSDLRDGNTTVYIVMPDVETYTSKRINPWLRLLIERAIHACPNKGDAGRGFNYEDRVLFVLDEFTHLGKLNAIEKGVQTTRQKGITIWSIFQDLGQLQKVYGKESANSFMGAAACIQAFAVNDEITAEFISKRAGKDIALIPTISQAFNINNTVTITQNYTNAYGQSVTHQVGSSVAGTESISRTQTDGWAQNFGEAFTNGGYKGVSSTFTLGGSIGGSEVDTEGEYSGRVENHTYGGYEGTASSFNRGGYSGSASAETWGNGGRSNTDTTNQGTNWSETDGRNQGINWSYAYGANSGINRSKAKGTNWNTSWSHATGSNEGINWSVARNVNYGTNGSKAYQESVARQIGEQISRANGENVQYSVQEGQSDAESRGYTVTLQYTPQIIPKLDVSDVYSLLNGDDKQILFITTNGYQRNIVDGRAYYDQIPMLYYMAYGPAAPALAPLPGPLEMPLEIENNIGLQSPMPMLPHLPKQILSFPRITLPPAEELDAIEIKIPGVVDGLTVRKVEQNHQQAIQRVRTGWARWLPASLLDNHMNGDREFWHTLETNVKLGAARDMSARMDNHYESAKGCLQAIKQQISGVQQKARTVSGERSRVEEDAARLQKAANKLGEQANHLEQYRATLAEDMRIEASIMAALPQMKEYARGYYALREQWKSLPEPERPLLVGVTQQTLRHADEKFNARAVFEHKNYSPVMCEAGLAADQRQPEATGVDLSPPDLHQHLIKWRTYIDPDRKSEKYTLDEIEENAGKIMDELHPKKISSYLIRRLFALFGLAKTDGELEAELRRFNDAKGRLVGHIYACIKRDAGQYRDNVNGVNELIERRGREWSIYEKRLDGARNEVVVAGNNNKVNYDRLLRDHGSLKAYQKELAQANKVITASRARKIMQVALWEDWDKFTAQTKRLETGQAQPKPGAAHRPHGDKRRKRQEGPKAA